MSSKPRVAYWNNMPAPYVVSRWNTLNTRNNLDFEAWFNVVRSAERSWQVDTDEWQFPARFIPKRRFLNRWLHLPEPELRDYQPDVIVCLYYQIDFAIGSLMAMSHSSRTSFLLMPTYDAWSERTWWRELSKHFLFRSADGAKVTGPEATALGNKYGLPSQRSHKVRQALNLEQYSRARQIPQEQRQKRRDELGLNGCVFLFVGRLWWGKGLDYLFDAYRQVQEQNPDVSLLIIGDGVDAEKYRTIGEALPGVVFTDFIPGDELPDYYALADVLVFPTLGDPYGYVVEEAMAAGLPVISSDTAGEIETRLPENEAGYIVSSRDADMLADRMETLAANPALREQMGNHAAGLVTDRDLEAYAIDFEKMIERTLSTPRRDGGIVQLARSGGGLLRRFYHADEAAPHVNGVG